MWRKKKSLSFLPPWEFQTPLSLGTPRLLINLPRNWLSQGWAADFEEKVLLLLGCGGVLGGRIQIYIEAKKVILKMTIWLLGASGHGCSGSDRKIEFQGWEKSFITPGSCLSEHMVWECDWPDIKVAVALVFCCVPRAQPRDWNLVSTSQIIE